MYVISVTQNLDKHLENARIIPKVSNPLIIMYEVTNHQDKKIGG